MATDPLDELPPWERVPSADPSSATSSDLPDFSHLAVHEADDGPWKLFQEGNARPPWEVFKDAADEDKPWPAGAAGQGVTP